VQGIFGGVEQHAPGVRHGEAAQAGHAGRNRDGEAEGEEGFAAFGLAADDSDRLLGPQGGDEPALAARATCQNGVAVKLSRHHVRQRSTVRRLTPTNTDSCSIRAAVAPSRMIAISTTMAAR
jgi:hypothetical protein